MQNPKKDDALRAIIREQLGMVGLPGVAGDASGTPEPEGEPIDWNNLSPADRDALNNSGVTMGDDWTRARWAPDAGPNRKKMDAKKEETGPMSKLRKFLGI